jgi:ketosteroid isomerase-like protein
MAQEDVEKVRVAYEAFGNGDLEGAARDFADDVEWWSSEETPEGGTIRGRDQVVASWSRLPDHWDDFAVEPREFADAGDKVLVVGTLRGTAKNGGRSFEARYAHVFWMADGRVTRAEFHDDSAKEAAAAG